MLEAATDTHGMADLHTHPSSSAPPRWPRRVIAGYDGSPASETACAFALWLAGKAGGEAALFHACPEEPELSRATSRNRPSVLTAEGEAQLAEDRTWRQRLDELGGYAATGATVESVLARGSATAALLEEVACRPVDLMLVGSTGVGTVRGTLMGSVSSQLVRHAPCPVLLFPSGQDASPSKVEAVVVGIDGSAEAAETLRMAEELARPLGARLVLVTAYPTSAALAPPTTELRGELSRHAAGLIAEARAGLRGDVEVLTEVAEGSPRHALITSAERHGPAIVAVGNRGLGGFHGLLLGGTARWIANHASCPVLIGRRTT